MPTALVIGGGLAGLAAAAGLAQRGVTVTVLEARPRLAKDPRLYVRLAMPLPEPVYAAIEPGILPVQPIRLVLPPTGSVRIEMDRWVSRGRTPGPDTRVRISGEVERSLTTRYVSVERLTILN